MPAKNEGRFLDKNFEKQINSGINDVHEGISSNIHEAHKYMQKKQSMIEDAVSEHPFEFVLGAFVGGLFVGALLSKR